MFDGCTAENQLIPNPVKQTVCTTGVHLYFEAWLWLARFVILADCRTLSPDLAAVKAMSLPYCC